MISFQARLSVRIQSIGKSTNGIPGGKLSLGRLESGSGYCVGGIVETKAGIKDIPGQIRGKGRSAGNTREGRTKTRNDRGAIGANGLKDIWIIGEISLGKSELFLMSKRRL